MKKVVIGILLIIVIAIILFFIWYNRNIQLLREIKKFNGEYEEYIGRTINGVDLTTIMNKAIENNQQYEIQKNKDGSYQNDGKYTIEIIVKPTKERKFISYGSI